MITLLFLLAIALGAAALVLWPMIRGVMDPWSVSIPEGEAEVHRQEQLAALEALRDLALDYRLGNIEAEDYRALAIPLQQQARQPLQHRAGPSRPPSLEELDAWLEEAIRARRKVRPPSIQPNGSETPPGSYCPQCGSPIRPEFRFCTACGTPLPHRGERPPSAPQEEHPPAGGRKDLPRSLSPQVSGRTSPPEASVATAQPSGLMGRRSLRPWLIGVGVLAAILWVGLIARLYLSARTQQETQIPAASLPGVPIQSLAITPNGLLVAEPAGLRLFEDEVTWRSLDVTADVRALSALDGAAITWLAAGPDGLWRSQDGGRTWLPFVPEPPDLGFLAMTAVPDTPGLMYAASMGDLWRSEDGGATWIPLNARLPGNPRALASDPLGILFLGTDRGVFRSEDGGTTWISMNGAAGGALISLDVRALAFDPDADMLFAGTPAGLSFMKIGAVGGWGERSLVAAVTALAMEAGDPPILWAGTSDGKIFRSPDRGVRWQP